MSRKKVLLNELASAFNDQDNVYYIIEEVFKSIQAFHKVKLIEDDYFNVVFNDICQKIFNVEAQRPSVIDLYDLNDIVIRQLTDYIIDHIDDFQTEKIIYKKQSQNEYKKLYKQERKSRGLDVSDTEDEDDNDEENDTEIQSNIKEIFEEERKPQKKVKKIGVKTNIMKSMKNGIKNVIKPMNNKIGSGSNAIKNGIGGLQIQKQEELKTLILDLTEIETMFNLDNVKSICLKTVDIINSDYMINKNNNYFTFKLLLQPEPKELYTDEIKVEIQEGNYDITTLIYTITQEMNKLTEYLFDVTHYTLNDIITISCINEEQQFQLTDGPLLDILGFKSCNVTSNSFIGYKPFFLSKRRTLSLGICLNNMEPIIYNVLYLNYGSSRTGCSSSSTSGTGGSSVEERTIIQPDVLHTFKNPISIDNIYLDFDTFNFRGVPFFVKLEIKYF
jgi:hypothetical protein